MRVLVYKFVINNNYSHPYCNTAIYCIMSTIYQHTYLP